jgi:hypothetical protein
VVTCSDDLDPVALAHEVRRLRAKADALEAALDRASQDLQLVFRVIPTRWKVVVSHVLSGDVPRPDIEAYYRIDWWDESTRFDQCDVEPALRALWATSPVRGSAP